MEESKRKMLTHADFLFIHISRGKQAVKSYSSFLVRCWLLEEETEAQPKQVFNIKHIQTGRQTRTSDLAEAQRWMSEVSQAKEPARVQTDTGDLSPTNARK